VQASRKHTNHARGRYARARFYTVQAGDSLTSIAAKTGISINTLEVLNPSANPNALQTGQQLRLRR
jgi:LysM repeat protein